MTIVSIWLKNTITHPHEQTMAACLFWVYRSKTDGRVIPGVHCNIVYIESARWLRPGSMQSVHDYGILTQNSAVYGCSTQLLAWGRIPLRHITTGIGELWIYSVVVIAWSGSTRYWMQGLRKNIALSLHSQESPHSSPSQASYGVSIANRAFRKI